MDREVHSILKPFGISTTLSSMLAVQLAPRASTQPARESARRNLTEGVELAQNRPGVHPQGRQSQSVVRDQWEENIRSDGMTPFLLKFGEGMGELERVVILQPKHPFIWI